MPNAQCTMHNAQCTMHNAQCPMPNAQCTCQTTMLHGPHLCWWVWLASLLFAAFAPLHVARCNCASLSLSYQFFHPDWLHGWLQLPVITGQVAKNVMEWIKIPGNLLPARAGLSHSDIRWIGAECFRNARKLSLFCSQAGLPPNLDAACWKKGMRWISLRIRKRKKREEVNMAANQETPRAELSSSLCRWVNLAIYYSDQGGEHCLHLLHWLHCLHCL